MQKPNYLVGALVGGALMGILSVIPIVSCCCFLWGILGGFLSAMMAAKPVELFGPKEGVMAGLAAGGAGVAFYGLANIPLRLFMAFVMKGAPRQPMPAEMPPALRALMESANDPTSPVGFILAVGIFAVIIIPLALGGGVIGGLVFQKPKGGAVPMGEEKF